MRMPSYTTRMMAAYLLLAMIAVLLGVGSAYKIKTSLNRMQSQISADNLLINRAHALHGAVEKRRRADQLFALTGDGRQIEVWNSADRDFSRLLAQLLKSGDSRRFSLQIKRLRPANERVKADWRLLVAAGNRPAERVALNARQFEHIDALEAIIDKIVDSQTAFIENNERIAVRDTDATLKMTLLVSAFVLTLAAAMALYISYTLKKPLAVLLGATQKISQGHLGHRIDMSRADEIGALTSAFDEMSEALELKDKQITGQLNQLTKTKTLLETYGQDLEQKNKEMESFIYSVSHDLKAPLIAIQGFLAMFASEFSSTLSEKAGFYLQRVQANSQQMQTLIQQLLELSRAGQTGGQYTNIDSRQLVTQVLDELHVQINAKNAQIFLAEDWPDLVAEPTMVKQALTNLVDNALHYSHNERTPTIHISVEETDDSWRFHVEDNGVGIDVDYQDKVFDMFERLSESREKNRHGTGIGLAIVRKIAEGHGGLAGVKSSPGMGSTFYFDISKNLTPRDIATAEVL